MTSKALLSPDAFVGLEGITHLCTGGEAPWLKCQDEVYGAFGNLKSGSAEGRASVFERSEACRRKVGLLWQVPAARVSFVPAAAEGMNWLARGLDWRVGDNVVTTNLEFPSVAYAWKNLRAQGVEVRMVPHRNFRVYEEDLLAAVDERTRVLAVSQVSFYTGQNLDIEALSAVRQRDVLLAVDATHASGVLQVPASATDLCVSSSYKWMLATHGTASCYLSEKAEEQTAVSCYGWHNLEVWPAQQAERHAEVTIKSMPEKMEPGNRAMVVVLFLDRALDVLLEIGKEQIEHHARDLSEQVGEGLQKLGYRLISPQDRRRRSGNTCFLVEDTNGLQQRLAQNKVLVWGDFGRMRVSGHLYNSSTDIEHFLEVLAEVG